MLKASNVDLLSIGLTPDEIESLKSSVSVHVQSGTYLTGKLRPTYETLMNFEFEMKSKQTNKTTESMVPDLSNSAGIRFNIGHKMATHHIRMPGIG